MSLSNLHNIISDKARSSPQHVAELLLMKQAAHAGAEHVGRHLYERLLGSARVGLVGRGDWGEIRSNMLALMPDQDALDAFAAHEGGMEVWFRITGFIARSLYTEVTTVMSSALGILQRLSNDVRADKLAQTLQLLDIQVDVNSISMNDSGHGYCLSVTQAQRDRIAEIHARQRRNFHITQEIAQLLYQEVQRRTSENPQEYTDMQALNNRRLEPVPHPTIAGRSINAPPKIFRACAILQVVIDRWEFNRFDGYRVSAEDPETIDALERTADWSRQQKALEQGDFVQPVKQGRGAASSAARGPT